MESSIIWQKHPFLYHMATGGSWQQIFKHGLLSTTALLDLFDYQGASRDLIESSHRPESIPIKHSSFGTATIRDQKPMSDASLDRCLNGFNVRDWYRLLNRMVFFWVTKDRLATMLNARAYRDKEQDVLIVDSKSLIAAYEDQIVLSPINSGCTIPYRRPRGTGTFCDIKAYPYETWKQKRGKNGDLIVELAVKNGVPNIQKYVVKVETWLGDTNLRTNWNR